MYRNPVFLLGIALSLVVLFCADKTASAAGRVFYDDFEAYSVGTLPTTKWSQNDRDLPQVVVNGVDGGAPHGGSRQVKLNWCGTSGPQGNPNCTYLQTYWFTSMSLASFSYTNEFLFRIWWRSDANKDTSDGAKMLRFNDVSGSGDYSLFQQDGCTHEIWQTDTVVNSNNWCVTDFDDRQWHKVEVYVKQANSGGVIKRWDNDVLRYSYTGDTTNAANNKYYPIYIGSNWSENPGWEHDAINNWYVDDAEVFSDTGTGGSGLMSDGTMTQGGGDTTPPAVPTGLAVQ